MADYLAPINPKHSAVSIGTNSTSVIAANKARRYLLIANDGSVTVYIALGVAAVTNQGIPVMPNGGAYEMSQDKGNLFLGAVNGTTPTGVAAVLVTEGV